jgi:hypothetical protein
VFAFDEIGGDFILRTRKVVDVSNMFGEQAPLLPKKDIW